MVEIPDEEQRLAKARLDTARDKETFAIHMELEAAMWNQAVAGGLKDPVILEQQRHHQAQAEKARSEATKMHALAGSTPETFAGVRAQVLTSQLDTYRQQVVIARDAKAHPEAYGERTSQPEVWEAGIEIVEAALGGEPIPVKAKAE